MDRTALISQHRKLLDLIMRINTRLAVAKAFPVEAALTDEEDEQLRTELADVETQARELSLRIKELT